MAICCALLKHDYSNFSLIILEYCESSNCLIREKHYWDLLNPEYNIAKDPTAPMSGRKHSEKSKIIMSPSFGGMLKKEKIILIMVKLLTMKLKQKYLMLCLEILIKRENQDPKELVNHLNK